MFSKKLIGLGLIVSSSLFAAPTPPRSNEQASEGPGQVQVRVRLAEALPIVTIRGFDLRIRQSVSRTLASAPNQNSEWEFHCQGDRIRAISTRGGRTLDLQNPAEISSPVGVLHFQDRPYRERLYIHSVGSLCEVVNELDIEKYLSGLVNAEFSSHWNAESVGAQVIAARTYALYQIRRARERAAKENLDAHFDLDATVRDQVYDGYVREDFRAARAVERTRGMVLLAPEPNDPRKIEPIKAFYHSSCAGTTELPQNVWGGKFPGFNRRVSCPFCAASSHLNWNLELTSSELAALIFKGALNDGGHAGWPGQWTEILRGGQLLEIHAARRDASNRRPEVSTTWAYKKNRFELLISGARLRDWIGAARFKSTAFDVSAQRLTSGAGWHFHGRGNGHGVGMCQLGAKYLGEKGMNTAGILKHYYPDALLKKLW